MVEGGAIGVVGGVGGTLGVVVVAVGGGNDGVVLDWKMTASSRRALSLVGSIPASGEAGVGLRSALMRSVAAALAASMEEVLGIGVWVGWKLTVSMVRSALVSSAKTR